MPIIPLPEPDISDGVIYCTLSTLKDYMRKDGDDLDDTLLEQALLSSSRLIDDMTGRSHHGFWLDETAVNRVLYPKRRVIYDQWGETLLIDDIGSTDDLLVEVTTWTSWQTISSTLYEFQEESAISLDRPYTSIRSLGSGWSQYRKVRITARWGWPSVPAQVQEACKLQASRLFVRKDSPEGVAGDSNWGIIRLSKLDPDVGALLTSLIIPGFS